MPSDPPAGGEARGAEERLHPSSAVFTLIATLRGLLFPFIALVFFSRGSGTFLYIGLVGVVPVMVGFLLKYVSYRYRLDRDDLVIREGILTRNERHVRYDRIQNIDLLQNPLHRLFGVAEVRIETASGGKPEAVIRVLSLDAVERMRRHVFAERDDVPAASDTDADAATARATGAVTLLHLPLREVVTYGLISNRGMVVVAAALGVLSQAGIWDFDEEALVRRMSEGAAEQFDLGLLEYRSTQIAISLVAVVVAAIVVMRLLSVALAVFKLYDFTLTRRGDDLRAEYGLFTRVSATIPIHRIQTLSTRDGLLHRLFGRTSIQVETAGGGGGDGEEGGSAGIERQWIAPVLPRERAATLVREILPDVNLDDPGWRPVEQRAWRRRLKPPVLLVAVVAAGTSAPLVASGLVALPVGLACGLALLAVGSAVAGAWAARSVAAEGWALTPHAVYYRSGVVARQVSVVRYAKIQALARLESPFDRRWRMARVHVDTAGATRIGHRVDIPYLTPEIADAILARLYAEASVTAFRW